MQARAVQSRTSRLASGQIRANHARTRASATDDPTKKLGVFVGKWETEGAFTSGQKTSHQPGMPLVAARFILDLRSTSQTWALLETIASSLFTRMTVRTGNYSYVTLSDPGAKPSTGGIVIKGNLWTYDSSFTANGKTTTDSDHQ